MASTAQSAPDITAELKRVFEQQRDNQWNVKASSAEERKGVLLMPVRIDDAVFETGEAWAVKPRDGRNIGDFRGWYSLASWRPSFLLGSDATSPVPAFGSGT